MAWLASRLGAPASLLARVGDDREAEEALRPLERAGVELSGVKRLHGRRTGLALIVVRADGEKSILLSGNANDDWEAEGPDEIAGAVWDAPAGSPLVLDLEVTPEVAERALQEAHRRGLPVVLDPSPAARFQDRYWSFVDYITPNPAEAERLVGFRPTSVAEGRRAAEVLRDRGVGHALVKLGRLGCVVASPDGVVHVSPPRVEDVDRTGAGDAFAGGLAYALWEGWGVVGAARFATTTAALAVTSYGSQRSYPDRAGIEEALRGLEGAE